jgi:hypothetical protein
MRLTLIALFFSLLVFADAQTQRTVPLNIPSGGQTITIDSLYMPDVITIGTNGAVNIGSNSYTLTYDALPPYGQPMWTVIMDIHQLTFSGTGSNITIFGLHPIVDNPGLDTIIIENRVVAPGVLQQNYVCTTTGGNFNTPVNFKSRVTFSTASVKLSNIPQQSQLPIDTLLTRNGDSISYIDCTPWCTQGNSGLIYGSFLGNIDNNALWFRVDNNIAGFIDTEGTSSNNTAFGLNALQNSYFGTAGTNNTAFGRGVLAKSNSSSNGNTGVGFGVFQELTSGGDNTAVGFGAADFLTTGSINTAIGQGSCNALTSGNYNTALGSNSLTSVTTGQYNIGIGSFTDVSAANTNYGICIGAWGNGIKPSSNQCAINGVRVLSLPSMSSGVGYYLADSSGNGDFVPMPSPSVAAWQINGNTNITHSNYFGTRYGDTAAIQFLQNGELFGLSDYNLQNTVWGFANFLNNTTGNQNTAVGYSTLQANTTGSINTAIGHSSALNITTGSGNIAVGAGALGTTTKGNYNIAIGYAADVANDSTQSAISLGADYSGQKANSSQFLVSGVRLFSIPQISSGVGYELTDSSGKGDFLSKPPYSSAAFDSAQTSAQTITSYSPPKNGTYSISPTLKVISVTTDSIQVAVTFTDETGASQTLAFWPMGQNGPHIGTTGVYAFSPMIIRASSASISVVTTLPTTGGSIKYNAGASIKWLGY